MILRILLLLAAYNAAENQNDQQVSNCVTVFAGVGLCCAIGAGIYAYAQALKEAQENYDLGGIPQNSIYPSNCDLTYQNDRVCLTIAAGGYLVQNAVQKCFPSLLHKIRNCLSPDGNNFATGITKNCSEEDLKQIKEQNQKIMDLVKEKTNLQPIVCRKFPTGLKILQNPFGYVFKNPTKTMKSGCFEINQTPQLSTSHCGKHAEMQLLPVGGGHGDFWNLWSGTDWEITFPKLIRQNPFKDYRMTMKKETNAWTNRLYEDFMHDLSLNLFKRRTYSIFIDGSPIARMNVQYLDGEKWYRVCKQRSGQEYLSWSQKCDINSFFATFHGYIDVPVRVEIEAKGQTSFRSQSRFSKGYLSSSASAGVFQCFNDFSGSWYNSDVNYGCDLVMRSNTGFKFSDSSGFGRPLWPKLEVSKGGADPLALMNLHASEYYTSKIQQEWERQYFKDKKIVEEREERERERQREIERKRKQREREREQREERERESQQKIERERKQREQRNQARTHSQNNYSRQNQRYPSNQQNKGYNPNNQARQLVFNKDT